MNVTLSPENLVLLVGMFGPLLVAAITGLKTPTKVKALLAVLIVSIFTAVQALDAGLSGDLIKDAVTVITIWGGSYATLWKGTGVAAYLQEKVPVYIGQAEEYVGTAQEVLDDAQTVLDTVKAEVMDEAAVSITHSDDMGFDGVEGPDVEG